MNRLLILLFILIDVNVLFSQETLSDTYTPSGNGYIMTVPFEFKFLNCIGSDGIPHLSVGKITKNAVSNKYKYNGKIYTEEDLGSESFSNMTKYIGYTDIEVVIWDGNWQLGTVRLTNVTGYNVGCQGQLYDVFKKLGINGKEYKEKINLLSIGNIRIIKISNSDAGLEMKIKDYDKNNKIKSLIDDANYSFSYKRYEDAENICNEIKKIDYSNARANEILEKIKAIRKEEIKKLDYNQFILKGDNYYAKKDFTNAIQEYKSALNTGYDNEKAQSKIREVETAEEKNNDLKEKEEEKVELEKPELGKVQTQQKENKTITSKDNDDDFWNGKSESTKNTIKTNNKGALNKTTSNNQNDKTHYESAIENIDKGNLSQAIKDLELQKAYTSDPVERAKIDANIQSVNSRQNYENDWAIMNQRIERDNYLNQQSLEFVNNVDAASNGDHLVAASQKFGYALGSAVAGKIDVNSITGTAVSVINLLGEKKREKEELEAKKRAIKEKIAEEDRMRELERQNFLNGLKRERKLVINNLPNYTYPNYLTNEANTTYYYFAIYTNQDILNTDYPEVDITDIIEIRKYKDGTWPFENDFKADLQKLSSKSIKHIIGFANYENAANKLSDIINGFGKGGIKLLFLKASESVSSKSAESDKDFWGNSLKTKKSKSTKKVIQKDSVSKKEDFWGKPIKTKE
tara:strand:+ start:24039 stop:26102 length:2064 start_codon:yes stop_codon:yes gene_type:complete